jgi:hypothetical protein
METIEHRMQWNSRATERLPPAPVKMLNRQETAAVFEQTAVIGQKQMTQTSEQGKSNNRILNKMLALSLSLSPQGSDVQGSTVIHARGR